MKTPLLVQKEEEGEIMFYCTSGHADADVRVHSPFLSTIPTISRLGHLSTFGTWQE